MFLSNKSQVHLQVFYNNKSKEEFYADKTANQ